MPLPFCSNLRHCLSSRFLIAALPLFSLPLHCYAPPILAAAVLVSSLLCRRGSELIISLPSLLFFLRLNSISGRRHSVPWLIISVLCLRKATQCLVRSGRVNAGAVLISSPLCHCCSALSHSSLCLRLSIQYLSVPLQLCAFQLFAFSSPGYSLLIRFSAVLRLCVSMPCLAFSMHN